MSTYGQTKLNKNDVRKGTLRFMISFVILTLVSFLSVYLFFKSSQIQNREMITNINKYEDVIQRHNLLKVNFDQIYEKMGKFGGNEAKNDILLRNNISKDITNCRAIIGSDSITEFSHYYKLTEQLNKMLEFKTKLISINSDEQRAERALLQCNDKVTRINTAQATSPKHEGNLVRKLK